MEVFLWIGVYTATLGGVLFMMKQIWKLVRRPVPRREPAPSLNPKWVCGHGHLIDVQISTGEVVAYICEKCDAQIDVDDRAAVAHETRKKGSEFRASLARSLEEEQEKIEGYRTDMLAITAVTAPDENTVYAWSMPDPICSPRIARRYDQ
jgi:hypothetical protein